MKNPVARMKEARQYLGETERVVADFFLKEPDVVLKYNIRELAEKLYISPATIVRFCKHLGFEGYREFRQSLIYELAMYAKSDKQEYNDITRGDSIDIITEKIISKNIRSLIETEKLLDMQKVNKCVDLILNASNIILFGMGASQSVAKDAYLKFLRLGKNCFTVEDWHAQLLMAKNSTETDVGIVITYSGETVEMVKCVQALKENRTPIIAITRFAPSTISSIATYVLYVSAGESVFRSGAISSRIAQLCMIDILYTAFASRDYDKNIARLQMTHIEKPNI